MQELVCVTLDLVKPNYKHFAMFMKSYIFCLS